jgi:hypothetical protein
MLFPTRIDAVEIGVPFYSLQTIDLCGWDGDKNSPSAQKLIEKHLAAGQKALYRRARSDGAASVGKYTDEMEMASPNAADDPPRLARRLIRTTIRPCQRDAQFIGGNYGYRAV